MHNLHQNFDKFKSIFKHNDNLQASYQQTKRIK